MLREDALFKKKQEKEANLIKVEGLFGVVLLFVHVVCVAQAYESELRDDTEFFRWQVAAFHLRPVV